VVRANAAFRNLLEDLVPFVEFGAGHWRCREVEDKIPGGAEAPLRAKDPARAVAS
jgi:hypothetical protein